MRRTLGRATVALLLLVFVAGAVSCAAAPPGDHPAAKAVQALLELRRDDVRDPKAYAPYFLESSLATAIADASGEATGAPRVPEWESPYVSEETSDSASVVVIWRDDPDFEGWPAINVFMLQLVEERWVVIDATEATAAPEPVDGKRKR